MPDYKLTVPPEGVIVTLGDTWDDWTTAEKRQFLEDRIRTGRPFRFPVSSIPRLTWRQRLRALFTGRT